MPGLKRKNHLTYHVHLGAKRVGVFNQLMVEQRG